MTNVANGPRRLPAQVDRWTDHFRALAVDLLDRLNSNWMILSCWMNASRRRFPFCLKYFRKVELETPC